MNFSCNKKDLSEAINNILPAVSSKSTLIALEGILIECNNNILNLTSYNLEFGITKSIIVKSIDDGKLILNANLLSNIINKMPDGEININSDEKLLTIIECNQIEFTILGQKSDEFPEMPSILDNKEFKIDNDLLKNMINQTLFSISQNDQTPVHTGSLFDIKNKMLNIVSVDGYRLALRKEKINVDEDFKFIVPGKTLNEIVKLLSKISNYENEDVIVSFSNKHISFKICGYIIISRLLEGQFLDYENAIPKDKKTSVIVNKKDFLDSISRASIIINERAKSPIQCEFDKDKIKLFCETSLGKINDETECINHGEEIKIGFNNKYMSDALKASDCDEILIKMNGPISPITICPKEDEYFIFLVLPVRLK